MPFQIAVLDVGSVLIFWRASFTFVKTLEKEGKLRCLRVANHKDLIPEMPDRRGLGLCVTPSHIFRHVGMELSLFEDKKPDFVYAGSGKWTDRFRRDSRRCVLRNFFCCTMPLRNIPGYMSLHQCQKYVERLDRVSCELDKVKLHELYDDQYQGLKNHGVRVSIAR